MSSKNEPVIEVKNVDIIRSKEVVIEDATFTIKKSDYVGIVGPNGGGKTTLLLGILGIIPINKGSVKIFSTDVSTFSGWERIAYVPQDATSFDNSFPITVRELVGLGRINKRNIGKPLRKEDWINVDETLAIMGIEDIADKRIGELSGGQKQRLFIAKALVRNPEILILDEPVTGVDANTLEGFYKKLSDLNTKRNITILIVSHDLSSVFCRMSKVLCVNKHVYSSDITPGSDINKILKRVYGEHFHFVFHDHLCRGEFYS
ncbi:MAG: metal ABC transporter ATP-binding protein [Candidatus Thermoplasmatota archaeon]